jgi:hypothetical protein
VSLKGELIQSPTYSLRWRAESGPSSRDRSRTQAVSSSKRRQELNGSGPKYVGGVLYVFSYRLG